VEEGLKTMEFVSWEPKFPGNCVYLNAEKHDAGRGTIAFVLCNGYAEVPTHPIQDCHKLSTYGEIRRGNDDKVIQIVQYVRNTTLM